MTLSGVTTGLSPLRDNVVLRLLAYYVGFFLFFVVLGALFPSINEYMIQERLRVARGAEALGAEGGLLGTLSGAEAVLTPERSVPVLVSMLAAFALALPVAWVYTWTSQRSKVSRGVARALLVLPIAISFVVFLVKGSLALAFSLAGIVAAVRFRTSLSDTMDAVFLFVVIGIGLSAGVQLLSVAFIASVLFTTLTLTVFRTRFAEDPPWLEGFRLCRAGPVGSQGASGFVTPPGAGDSGGQGSDTVLLVHSDDPERAKTLAELVFGRHAKKWTLRRIEEGQGGTSVLEFQVRLKKWSGPATVVDLLRESGGPSIGKVESVPAWGTPHPRS